MSSGVPTKRRALEREGSHYVGADVSPSETANMESKSTVPLQGVSAPDFARGTSLSFATPVIPSGSSITGNMPGLDQNLSIPIPPARQLDALPPDGSLPPFLAGAPGPASAASMLRAAAAFAAEAGASPAALHAMSNALVSQAQRQGQAKQHFGLTTSTPGSAALSSPGASSHGSARASPATSASSPGRRLSAGGSLRGYASGMNAQLSQAIARQQAVSSSAGTAAIPVQAGSGLGGSRPDAAQQNVKSSEASRLGDIVARAEMTDIAVRAAAQEAQAQGVVHEMIRSRSQNSEEVTTSPKPGEVGLGSSPSSRRRSWKLGRGPQEMSARASPGETTDSLLPPPAVDAYLANLGLAHIQVPLVAPASSSFASSSTMPNSIHLPVPSSLAASVPFHQAASSLSGAFSGLNVSAVSTQADDQESRRRWDEADPVADLKLGGVPSMPLMPAPGLQMLPPPDSPLFLLDAFAKATGRWEKHQQSVQRSSPSGAEDPTAPSAALKMTTHGRDPTQPTATDALPAQEIAPVSAADAATLLGKFPFQIVQTPGGTARPGWWIPTDALAESQKQALQTEAAAAAVAKKTEGTQVSQRDAYFQPR